MTISAANLTRLRTRPHKTKLYLSIYKPTTVFTATVNGDQTRGETSVAYTAVTGVYTDIKYGMTVLVGTVANSRSLGSLRVRAGTTATKLKLAESGIIWTNGTLLTVINYYEPWGVYPTMVKTSPEVATYYKDVNIDYSNQNHNFGPVPFMGPHRAKNLAAGSASLYFGATGSYDHHSGTLTYSWTFPGGTPATSTSITPGWVVWTTAGHRAVELTVTNGTTSETYTGHRHVSIYDTANPSFIKWGVQGLSGAHDSGGWSGSIWVRELADKTVIVPGAQVVIYAEDWYGTEKISLGGNYLNNEDIVFAGYIRDGSIDSDPETGQVTFQITTVDGRIKTREIFGISVFSVDGTPATWYEMKVPTVDEALYQYLRWHSTLLGVADVRKIGSSDKVSAMDFARAPFFQTYTTMSYSTHFAKTCSDRQGSVWNEIVTDLIPITDRTLTTAMTIKRTDWRDKVTASVKRETACSYAEVSGYVFNGGVDADALVSSAPGPSPLYDGTPNLVGNLVLHSKAETLKLSGNLLAHLNKELPEVNVPLAGNYRMFDIAPQERVLFDPGVIIDYMDIDLSSKTFIPRRITLNYKAEEQTMLVDLVLAEETDGPPGVDGPYPEDDTTTPEPCVNCPPPPCSDCAPVPSGSDRVYVATAYHVGKTSNFSASSPNWVGLNFPSASFVLGEMILDFNLDPWDSTGNRCIVVSSAGVWRCINMRNANPTWTKVLTGDGSNIAFEAVRYTIAISGRVYLTGYYDYGRSRVWMSNDYGATWTIKYSQAGYYEPAYAGHCSEAGQHNGNIFYHRVASATGADYRVNQLTIGPAPGYVATVTYHDFYSSTWFMSGLYLPYYGNTIDSLLYLVLNNALWTLNMSTHTMAGIATRSVVAPGFCISPQYTIWAETMTPSIMLWTYIPVGGVTYANKVAYSADSGSTWVDRSPSYFNLVSISAHHGISTGQYTPKPVYIWYTADYWATRVDKTGDWNTAIIQPDTNGVRIIPEFRGANLT